MTETQISPRAPIRRFDVFAEYNRLKGLKQGLDEPHAKGYGLWVAKVVASGRRGGQQQGQQAHHAEPGAERPHDTAEAPGPTWHELGGEPQTDALFDHEVIQRMDPSFYAQVFAPAIAEAAARGEPYESIRDSIRKGWTPAKP